MEFESSCVPPGFRFHPTEEELVGYYLKRKVESLHIDLDVIVDIDLYRMEPWDIEGRCKLGYEEQNEWFFFSHKDRKYPTGTRTNRATASGFWKATGRDKAVLSKDRIIGMRKTLVFYNGRAPNGRKSDWIMHEYRLQSSHHAPSQSVVRVGAWGGSGGTGPWTYLVPDGTRLQQIQVVTNGRCVYSIQFISFNPQTGRLVNSDLYGNDANLTDGTTQIVEIPNGQHLTVISGTFGAYQDLSNIITSLSFRVGRNLKEFGGKTGTTFSLPVNRGAIKGFFGNSGDYLDSLGVILAPL